MKTTVYILRYGLEDTPRIGGVYSTRAAAEAALRFGEESSEISVYEVDAPLPVAPEGCSLWKVNYAFAVPEFTTIQESAFECRKPTDRVTLNDRYGLMIHLWAPDAEAATQAGAAHFTHYLTAHGTALQLDQMKSALAQWYA